MCWHNVFLGSSPPPLPPPLQLASKCDCDDDEMVKHIHELLDDLGKEGGEEGGGDKVEEEAGESGEEGELEDCADLPMDVS